MITPGFFSYFNTHRALMTSQNALDIVNHNIANANTPGYTRQRAEIQAYVPYSTPSLTSNGTGQKGQGSVVAKIERLRDAFIDKQFRLENGLLGMNEMKRSVMNQVEGILTEPSDAGITSAMQKFFDAAQALSVNPESIPVRQDFMQQASDLISVFQQQGEQLQALRTSLVGDPVQPGTYGISQANILATQVNEKLSSIAALNREILAVNASGAQPNDLLDQRDKLIDDLSKMIDITVTNYDNGLCDIAIGHDVTNPANPGATVIRGVVLADTLEYVANAGPAPSPHDVPGILRLTNTPATVFNDGTGVDLTSGTMKGILDMGRGDAVSAPGTLTDVTVRTVFQDLSQLMTEVFTQINTLQQGGVDLLGNFGTANPIFNTPGALPPGDDPLRLLDWSINQTVINDPRLVAAAQDDIAGGAADFAGPGDGRTAILLAQLRNQSFAALGGTSINGFMNSVVSDVGIDSNAYQSRTIGQTNLTNSLEQRRQSVSGVSTDEELIDLMRFQRSFEASSKVMKVIDEIMRTIIQMT